MARFAAHYYDGRTAARRDVTIGLAADGVQIIEDGSELEWWRLEELRLVPDDTGDPKVRLGRAGNDTARLLIADPFFRDELFRHCPHMEAADAPRAKLLKFAVWGGGTAVTAALVVGLFLYLPAAIAGLVPQSWEERVGRQTVGQIINLLSKKAKDSRRCTGAAGRAALDRLMGRLGAGITTPYDLHVTVADVSIANAFAAPGGQLVVLSGLFDLATTPDELSGVLAHEIGHVIRRHPMQSVLRAQGLSLLLDLMTGNMAGGDIIAGAGQLVIGASYSRGAEAEADRAAVEILGAAGISTDGLASFFHTLAEKEGSGGGEYGSVFQLMSSHPRSAERAKAVATSKYAVTGPALTDQEWRDLKQICNGTAGG